MIVSLNPISANRVVYDPTKWVNWVIFILVGKVSFSATWRCFQIVFMFSRTGDIALSKTVLFVTIYEGVDFSQMAKM